jgi:hypothetical protein
MKVHQARVADSAQRSLLKGEEMAVTLAMATAESLVEALQTQAVATGHIQVEEIHPMVAQAVSKVKMGIPQEMHRAAAADLLVKVWVRVVVAVRIHLGRIPPDN